MRTRVPSPLNVVRVTLAALVALVVGALLVVPVNAATAADRGGRAAGADARGAEPLDYVAMGDSYSAASGVLPPDPEASPACLRSLVNYPHLVAEATGASLTDVTCGGAKTQDYRRSQSPGVAPQLDALSRGTDLVTMTIGGNDGDVFINSILKCGVAGATTAGRGDPCREQYGSSFVDRTRNRTFPALVRALEDVQAKAPRAEVAILSYPWILPKKVGCFDQMPVARGDVPYLRNLQRVLNNAVRRAAERTGATYVGLNRFSDGHDACQPIGTRWIEPVLQGTNPVVVHPNALGEQKMAARAMRVLGLS